MDSLACYVRIALVMFVEAVLYVIIILLFDTFGFAVVSLGCRFCSTRLEAVMKPELLLLSRIKSCTDLPPLPCD